MPLELLNFGYELSHLKCWLRGCNYLPDTFPLEPNFKMLLLNFTQKGTSKQVMKLEFL